MKTINQLEKAKIALTCKTCGEGFERYSSANRNSDTFCSSICYQKSRTPKTETLICAHCEKTFVARFSANRKRKFCSKDCASLRINYAVLKCVVCAKSVNIDERRGPNFLCSQECAWTSLRKPKQPASVEKDCLICGKVFTVLWRSRKNRFCSKSCGHYGRLTGAELTMRKAIIQQDIPNFLKAVEENTVRNSKGCWEPEFLKTADKSYPLFRYGRTITLHRLMSTLVHGEPIKWAHSHHKCANTLCVNPEHLQWVTPKANEAEMIERNWYIRRIAELEAELAEAKSLLNSKTSL